MSNKKYTCPPQSASGAGTFSNNLVGLQLVDGGGLTQGNFEFTTNITEKQNRTFTIGTFSDPINLNMMGIENVAQSKEIIEKNFRVYPNYDLSLITNFTLYGSLVKRISVSIEKIINFFPAAIEVLTNTPDYRIKSTAINIVYDKSENETFLEIPLDVIRNPFDIDFTENANINSQTREITVSPLRNFTENYKKYSIFVDEKEYPITFFTPTNANSQTLELTVNGQPFEFNGITDKKIIIKPTELYINRVFSEDFDPVEKFLLNRDTTPIFTAAFKVPKEGDDGRYYVTKEQLTFPRSTNNWNLDIVTVSFTNYLNKLNDLAENLDSYQTNLVSRFLTTGAFKEFDTQDQKVEKILQIYGRSFDQTKQFIDALSTINSVNYTVKNDIPSQLLKNLAQTLGWNTNISPISNEELLSSVFKTDTNTFSGLSIGKTPEELNYQYYRNLILNSAYLFKSKGTRKSIEILLRLIGAPEPLIEFNEYIYIADQKININQFNTQFAQISGGTYSQQIPVLDTTDIFSIMGQQYTGFTTQTVIQDVNTTIEDYPVDEQGYPKMPQPSDNYYFQIGGGWFESTPQHRMPEQTDITNSVFTGSNPNIQTTLLPFNYGEQYLQRYKTFPFIDNGFKLRKVVDNKKSWNSIGLDRSNFDGGFNANYIAGDDKLVINVKNVDIFLNPSQGLVYDVWSMSRNYNYPIPEEGLNYIVPTSCNPNPNTPYPQRGGIDWTEIVPKPKQKTFFEFAQTFWQNTINVRNRQFITDGKTGGYPTLQSIYWKYLESESAINIPNDNFTYQTMIDYVNGLGDYWTRLIEQMIPATTIWNTGVKMENSIFHRQKFVWRRQRGCQIVPVPCKPCQLVGQIFAYDCPIQSIECDLLGYNGSPTINNFNTLLGQTITNNLVGQGKTLNNCLINTIQSNWYVNIKFNNIDIANDLFFQGVGLNNGNLSAPTEEQWINAVSTTLDNLQNYGLSYFFNSYGVITVYNNNCVPLTSVQDLQINTNINFNILCNQ